MRLCITGATGFVGAHASLRALRAGHSICLLVRRPEHAQRYFEQADLTPVERSRIAYVKGNMCQLQDVQQAMDGCEAVLHAAASVSLDPSRAQATLDNNRLGVENVMSCAQALRLQRIVYVSSLAVMAHPDVPFVDEQTPLVQPANPYARSKLEAELYVRRLQSQGVPVQIVYPAAIVGPDDPGLSQANAGMLKFLGGVVPKTSSGFQCVDVRDLAQALLYCLEHPVQPPCEQARFIVGGVFHSWTQVHRLVEQATGRTLWHPPVPGAVLRQLGRSADWLKRWFPIKTVLTHEGMTYATQWSEARSTRFAAVSGLAFRTGEETFRDTFKWLIQKHK